MAESSIKTIDDREHYNAYCYALGLFMDTFAKLEYFLHALLSSMMSLHPRDANAVLSGLRAEPAISAIRRLYQAREEEVPDDLEAALLQLNVLNKLRNEVAHYGARWNPDGSAFVTNESRVHILEAVSTRPVSEVILKEATIDIGHIGMILAYYELNGEPPNLWKDEREIARKRAWLYKSPPPPPPRHKNPKTRAKRQPPPAS
jgi:hypothetical protein